MCRKFTPDELNTMDAETKNSVISYKSTNLFNQVLLLKILPAVNSQIRIRDISALMPSGQGGKIPLKPLSYP
jgi:hypothetical protein